MDGLREYHAQLNMPKTNVVYHLYIEYKNNINDSIYETETDLQRKQTHSYQRGKESGGY